MITKLVDKVSEEGAGIDLVFELRGQQAHDIVPGAFIAKKAGASVVDLNNNEITLEKLEEVMLKPNTEKLTYVISATKELSTEMVGRLSSASTTSYPQSQTSLTALQRS